MATKKRTSRERVKRAEVAWRELELGALGPTEKERIFRVLDGMVALDQEQMRVKGELEDLIEEYSQKGAVHFNALLQKLTEVVNRQEKGPCLERTPRPKR